MVNKKGLVNPIDLIVGILLIMAGVITAVGYVNFGTVLAGLGLLVEAIKIMIQKGF